MNNDLFLNNIDFVKKIVNKMDYGYVDKDDLYQSGLIGLYKATLKYNENLNNDFLSFASIYIINEIKNELRNNKLIKLNKKILKIKKYIKNNDVNNKSLDEIANDLNVSKEIVILSYNYINDVSSLNEVQENEELLNLVASKSDDINKNLYRYYIDKLDYLSKEIIILKYYKNYTQSEIAKLLKCSQSTVSRIEKNALRIIKKNIS